jgi:signal transduction histidine kinase
MDERILILILVGACALAWVARYARKRQKLSGAVRQNPKRAPLVFLWQAVFILLPVAVMAAFGFWAILHQRRVVEQEAQQRATEIIQTLPDDFGRLSANSLTQYDAYKGGWFSFLEWGVAGWPGSKTRQQYLGDTNELSIISNSVTTLRAAFPDRKDGAPPLVQFLFDTNGLPKYLDVFPPSPPPWLLTLSADQYQAWTSLISADRPGQTVSNLLPFVREFRDTHPPATVTAVADFFRLRAEMRDKSSMIAMQSFLDFAREQEGTLSESGVPLTSLALAEALRRANECGPNEKLWELLRAETVRAGILAPGLLDQAAGLVRRNAQLSESVRAMQILLADRQAQRQLAQALAQTGYSPKVLTTNLWVNALGRRWFCIVQPGTIRSGTIVSNKSIWMTNTYPEVRCYPKSLVAQAFTNALAETKIALPQYFGVSCALETEPIPLPPPWDGTSSETLAAGQFHMSLPAIMLSNPGNGPRTETPFEDMPGHPEFTLRIQLTDRPLLYARQRQLQTIFGSLIALSTLSAFVGFIAAYHSFQRQKELSDLKTNFVSSVSHELRAPIASVRLMAENLESGKIAGAPKQNEYFRFIVQECRRLSSLIENVLDFSRIEQGRKQYAFEQTDLAALTRITVKLMEPYAAEKGVWLKLEPLPESVEASVDGQALQQALVNLIDNAVKHSPKGETVTAGITSQDGTIKLFVADHGPGIPRGEQEKIFERFYRLGSELRRETQGVGIGLSVVKHIVAAHNGRVMVQSDPGHGSRFTIELPPGK